LNISLLPPSPKEAAKLTILFSWSLQRNGKEKATAYGCPSAMGH
jgi:hypothetical protein